MISFQNDIRNFIILSNVTNSVLPTMSVRDLMPPAQSELGCISLGLGWRLEAGEHLRKRWNLRATVFGCHFQSIGFAALCSQLQICIYANKKLIYRHLNYNGLKLYHNVSFYFASYVVLCSQEHGFFWVQLIITLEQPNDLSNHISKLIKF